MCECNLEKKVESSNSQANHIIILQDHQDHDILEEPLEHLVNRVVYCTIWF